MPSVTASALALVLCAAVMAPLAWAGAEARSKAIAVTYIALIIVVLVYNIGFFQRSSLAGTDVVVRASVPDDNAQCRDVLALMQQAGLSVDRSDLSAPKIVGSGAAQIPAEVSEILIKCSEAQVPESDLPSASSQVSPIVPEN